MSMQRSLFSTVVAIGIAALAVAVTVPASAQQAVVIDGDDRF
jgi:hypothetical protein